MSNEPLAAERKVSMVPAPRPGLLEEYEQYLAACAEYNRRGLQDEPDNSDPVRLAQANFAPRCRHVRTGGVRCMAPALRGRTLCYAHTRIAASKQAGLQLPPLEDSSGVALAVMQIVQQLLDGKIDRKTAAVTLYGIQIVASTLNHKPFAAPPTSVVLEAAGLPPEEELLDAIEDVKGAQTGPGARPDISEKTSSNGSAKRPGARPDISEKTPSDASATRPGARPDISEKTSRDGPAKKPPAAELENNNAQGRGG
jgi:hypothetical protein